MELLEICFLAVLQGVTEFLPVSSSAHLLLFSELVQGSSMSLSFNVALHMGTLFAILWCFRADWMQIWLEFFQALKASNSTPTNHKATLLEEKNSFLSRMLQARLVKLAVATIPAGLAGILFKDQIEFYFHNTRSVIAPLALVGVLLWFVDSRAKSDKNASELSFKGCLMVGFFQALALIPGVSRSGITMLAARLLGVSRTESARFSFWLGTPVMIAAGLVELKHLMENPNPIHILLGIVVSFASGVLTMKVLLKFLGRFGFGFFAVYRLVLAASILVIMRN